MWVMEMSKYITVKDNLDIEQFSIVIDDEELLVTCEISMNGKECLLGCDKINNENKLYMLDNGQYLYKGLCCGVFTLLEVIGEDNGLATG